MVLGHGFLWSDLACYAPGVTLGVVIERTVQVHYRPKEFITRHVAHPTEGMTWASSWSRTCRRYRIDALYI